MNNPLVLNNIKHGYGKGDATLWILKGVCFEMKAGEMVALVAPSGSGKSTLLHIAGLLETPRSGEIFIKGKPCHKEDDTVRTYIRGRSIGFVYQSHRLLPEFDALENVAIPQILMGASWEDANKRAKLLLEQFGLQHRLTHRSSELSGGEQQRVAIARALANKPSVILADEPTGNLDPVTSGIVFQELVKVCHEQGVSALIATHNHELANTMTRKVTLKDGLLEDF